MVQATRWRQDTQLEPTNPYQRVRTYVTFPAGGGGRSAFGWSPIALGDAFKALISPTGVMPSGGLSAPFLPGATTFVKVVGAIAGIALGRWLAIKNLEG